MPTPLAHTPQSGDSGSPISMRSNTHTTGINGVLQITIHSGSGLSAGIFGKKDPYVIGQVGSNKFHTTAIKNAGKNPKWEQTFSFPYKNEEQITFRVLDKDHLSRDDLMGEGSIDISCLAAIGRLNTSIPIEKKKSPAGVLTCTIELKQSLGSYVPMPVPPTQENMNYLPSPPPYPMAAGTIPDTSQQYQASNAYQPQQQNSYNMNQSYPGPPPGSSQTYYQQPSNYYAPNYGGQTQGNSAYPQTGQQYRSGGPPALGSGNYY